MTKSFQRAAILCLALVCFGETAGAAPAGSRLLVRVRRAIPDAVMRDAGVRSVAPPAALSEWRVVTLEQGVDPRRSARILSSGPSITGVEPDRDALVTGRMPDDLRSDQWALENTGQRIRGEPVLYDADIDAPEAWELSTGSRGILVAVLDTGVALDHPDLGGALLDGMDFFTGGAAHDASALGHGTAVAGIIGARGDNALGIAGVSWDASLLPMRVCDERGRCPYSSIIAALDAAARRGVRVVNLSMSCDEHQDPVTGECGASRPGDCRSEALRETIEAAGRAGILVVTSAGNCDADLDDDTAAYPCSYDLDNLICAGATDARDEPAAFSNHGARSVQIAAPGTDIVSLSRDLGRTLPWDGTSFASPFVAGTASLLLSRNADLTPRALRARIVDGDRLAALDGRTSFGARLNAHRALEEIFLDARSLGGPVSGARGLMGDFDGDGYQDALETARRGVRVALGDGTSLGGFSMWSAEWIAGTPIAGDVNGDGRDDLVIVSRREIRAALSLGDRFDVVRSFGTAGVRGSVQVADVDGDRRADAIEARPGAGWFVHRSSGDRFDAPAGWSAPAAAATAWTLGDLDGDGRSDLLRLAGGEIGVSISEGDSFGPERTYRLGDGYPARAPGLLSGDVDGDGLSDVAVRAPDGCLEVALAAQRDDASGWRARPWACGRDGSVSALADVDGDGRDDLVRMGSAGGWRVLRSSR